MVEQIDLTNPVPPPRNNYVILEILLGWGMIEVDAQVVVTIKGDDSSLETIILSTGPTARADIRHLNKADLSVKSLHRRIMERLISDGHIDGTISGTPE